MTSRKKYQLGDLSGDKTNVLQRTLPKQDVFQMYGFNSASQEVRQYRLPHGSAKSRTEYHVMRVYRVTRYLKLSVQIYIYKCYLLHKT